MVNVSLLIILVLLLILKTKNVLLILAKGEDNIWNIFTKLYQCECRMFQRFPYGIFDQK